MPVDVLELELTYLSCCTGLSSIAIYMLHHKYTMDFTCLHHTTLVT